MDKKELVLQIEELEERIAPTVVGGGDCGGSVSGKSDASGHSGKSHASGGSGKSDASGGSA